MTVPEARELLPAYIAGELDSVAKRELESLLATNAELRDVLDQTKQIDVMLRDTVWIEPSPQFTRSVMRRAGLHYGSAAPAWVRNWEPAKVLVSVAMAAMIATWFGRELLRSAGRALTITAVWVDSLVGTTLFTNHPEYLLILVLPVIGAAVTTILISSGWRTDS